MSSFFRKRNQFFCGHLCASSHPGYGRTLSHATSNKAAKVIEDINLKFSQTERELELDMPTTYDVKYSFQTSDHDGWFLLDGRPTNLLTGAAATNAVTRFGNNLPDHRQAAPVPPSNPVDAVSGFAEGSNQVTLVQTNIPEYDLHVTQVTAATVDVAPGALSGATNASSTLTLATGSISESQTVTSSNNNESLNHRHRMFRGGATSTWQTEPTGTSYVSVWTNWGSNASYRMGISPSGQTSWVGLSDYQSGNDLLHKHNVSLPAMPSTNKSFAVDVALPAVPGQQVSLPVSFGGNHSVGVSSRSPGGAQDPLDITGRRINVNAFVYLY